MSDADRLAAEALYASARAAHLHTPGNILYEQDVLKRFVGDLHLCGVVGEDRTAKLIFLGVCSRVLEDPVSLAIKGVSSSGKSYTTETVLKFFPAVAYIEMTAMSEKALVYMKEPFSHRTIVLFEAVALREQREKTESNLTAYFVRSLLSEGRLSYPVTQKDRDGNWVTKTIIKEGPTNLIITTTAVSLHGENETRLLSLPTNDTKDQTKAILLQLAKGVHAEPDFGPWHALQTALVERAKHGVVVPFAGELAEQIPPVAVRLRRDFRSILRLIETHALLHEPHRDHDDEGRTIAAEEDYLVVRGLVADLLAEGVGATVSDTMRETVGAVAALGEDVTVTKVAELLQLDRSAAQRRLKAARERGYLVNTEERRGRPARYGVGDPMPEEVVLLPERALVTAGGDETAGSDGVCTSAATAEGGEGLPLTVEQALQNGKDILGATEESELAENASESRTRTWGAES
jgi:hypothetical protein